MPAGLKLPTGETQQCACYKSYKLDYGFRRSIRVEDKLVTWIYDETGNAGALLDEFCVRNLDGVPVAWVFGVTLFSIRGEHIGWFEHGVLFDVHNNKLGFVEGALGLGANAPVRRAAPPVPPFGKRPCVPALRARAARPTGGGWSGDSLADYLEQPEPLRPEAGIKAPAPLHQMGRDVSH